MQPEASTADQRDSSPRSRLLTLQAGRALAALSVAACHYDLSFLVRPAGQYPITLGGSFYFGRLGVDFFFVLSGFIILHAHKADIGRPSRLGHYVWKRLLRVFPVYWAILALSTVMLTVSGNLPRLDPLQWLSELTLVHWRPSPLIIGVEWTLFHEVLFYALFATLIINRWLGMAMLGLWFTVIAAVHRFPEWGDWSAANTVLSGQNLDFLFGMVVALAWQRLPMALSQVMAVAGVALFLALIAVEHAFGEHLWLRVPYGLSFAAMTAFLVKADERGWRRWAVPFVLVGNASYMLYLVHEPVGWIFSSVVKRLQAEPHIAFAMTLVGAVVASVLCHRYAELPLLKSLNDMPRRLLGRRSKTALTAKARS